MRLPKDVTIPHEKLLCYLLLPREENDKSKFLASAGYTLANWEVLEHHLHQFIQTNEVLDIKTSPYGIKYEIRGVLNGPNGRKLRVVTIWIKIAMTEDIRFVTLFPDRTVK